MNGDEEDHCIIDFDWETFLTELRKNLDGPLLVYLASALTGREPGEAEHDQQVRALIKSTIEGFEYHGIRYKVYDPADYTRPGTIHPPEDVYDIDFAATSRSDLVLFYANAPAYGAGMEAQIAVAGVIPRLVVLREGKGPLSRMFSGGWAPILGTIEFSSPEDLSLKMLARLPEFTVSLLRSAGKRRTMLKGMRNIKLDRFIFTHRVAQLTSIESLAKRTGLGVRLLTQLERDPSVVACLSFMQISLVCEALGAGPGFDEENGVIRIRGGGPCLDPWDEESLKSLFEFVRENGQLSDGGTIRFWQKLLGQTPRGRDLLAADDIGKRKPYTVADWRAFYDSLPLWEHKEYEVE